MSEPQPISELLPGVMRDIRERMEQRRARHDRRGRVVAAVRDFHQTKSNGRSVKKQQWTLWGS